MNGRGLRWFIAVSVGAGTLGLVWWVAEVWFGLDRSAAVTIAAAAASLVVTPSVWWASQTTEPAAGTSSPPSAPPADGVVTPRPPMNWPAPLPAAAVVAALVLVCFGAVQVYGRFFGGNGGDSGGGPRGQTGGGTSTSAGAQQSLQIDKTAWFAGYKLTFGRATYDRGRDPQLIVEANVVNLSTSGDYFTADMTFSIGGRHSNGFVLGRSLVPAGLTAELAFEFDPGPLNGNLADGVLTFGDGLLAQTIVPLAGGAGLVAHEPRQVLGPTNITHRDLVLAFRTCEVRADIVPEHRQARADHLVLACFIDATFVGSGSIHDYGPGVYRLRLPGGTTIGPIYYPITTLDPAVTKPDTYVAFSIREPVGGAYVLQIVDRHSSTERDSPTTIKDIPLNI